MLGRLEAIAVMSTATAAVTCEKSAAPELIENVASVAAGEAANEKGWGAKGDPDVGLIGRLAQEKP